jgi:biotin transport system substrate-specific component
VIDDTRVQHRMPGGQATDGRPAAPAARSIDPRSVALVAVLTALLVAAAVVPGIPVGGFGVPITVQTLAVLLTGLVLGPVRGGLAVFLYLVLGFVGLPVFSGGASGLQVLAGPTAGYLLSFVPAAVVVGAVVLARPTRRTP